MGGSRYSRDDYHTRTSLRASVASTKGIGVADATFAYDYDIRTGAATAAVHKTLDPLGVKIRESRDSAVHPVSVPIAVVLDTTGSMAQVPGIIQKALNKLMGGFLDDKASGKRYLGDGYPAIMIAAVDDYDAMRHIGKNSNGTFQVGQFESGIEIDDNLTNLWLTGHGGGTYEEQYELAWYFLARHTVHDHWEKRHCKGYAFLIGDEHPYPEVGREVVKAIIGDALQDDIPTEQILKEVQERYHVFHILPNLTQHYGDSELRKYWQQLLGQQNTLLLDDPNKICELIVGAVAICEEHIGLDELESDGVLAGLGKALVPLSKHAHAMAATAVDSLPVVPGTAGGADRL